MYYVLMFYFLFIHFRKQVHEVLPEDGVNKLDKKLHEFQTSEFNSLKADALEQEDCIQRYSNKLKQSQPMTNESIKELQAFIKEISMFIFNLKSLCIQVMGFYLPFSYRKIHGS